jgi:hypothetical protein
MEEIPEVIGRRKSKKIRFCMIGNTTEIVGTFTECTPKSPHSRARELAGTLTTPGSTPRKGVGVLSPFSLIGTDTPARPKNFSDTLEIAQGASRIASLVMISSKREEIEIAYNRLHLMLPFKQWWRMHCKSV